ncbi:MAG: hypothetical protein GX465_19170 [Acidobacteria bacterium]|nr:hypothetical protein [Acidobacteriota bacterium]
MSFRLYAQATSGFWLITMQVTVWLEEDFRIRVFRRFGVKPWEIRKIRRSGQSTKDLFNITEDQR